ncbi:MAG: hypothetical protein HZB80_06335 [Deltaproteobacteria bacterium]|nr:hypothetical protein [Deltaproteobacteria bacterium]
MDARQKHSGMIFSGNPVLVNLMTYGCPTEAFGHDNFKKGSFSEVPQGISYNMDGKERQDLLNHD